MKLDQEKDKYRIIFMWNLKYGTNELIYKTKRLTDMENKRAHAYQGKAVEGYISLGLTDTHYYK